MLHTDYQRILWRFKFDELIQEYRILTATFGTTSAPYLAIKSVHQLAIEHQHNFPKVSETILNDFYVDDLLTGDKVNEIIIKQQHIANIIQSEGFEIRKYYSNCSVISQQIPLEHRKTQFPLNIDQDDTIKTLGLYWHPFIDVF